MFLLPFENGGYSPLERYFIGIAYELVHRQTIDSYKVKFTNSLLILEELLTVIKGFSSGQIMRFETVGYVRDEAIRRIKEDKSILKYVEFNKEFTIKVLEDLKKDSPQDEREKVQEILKVIIQNNQSIYRTTLIDYIQAVLTSNTKSKGDFLNARNKLEKPIQYLFTDLTRQGFNKVFLLKFIYALFVKGDKKSFQDRYDEFKRVCTTKKKSFDVIFKCRLPSSLKKSGVDLFGNFERIDAFQYERLRNSTNPTIREFFKDGQHITYFRKKVDAYDRFSAAFLAKPAMGRFLDLIHLGFEQKALETENRVLILNISEPNGKADLSSFSFQLEGNYRSGASFLENLVEKVATIDESEWIQEDTKKKIRSAIRYLRLGTQAIEEEHRFLNYWIGLEYLFSDYSGGSTFTKIKEYLIPIHTNEYIIKNLLAFHNDLISLNCHATCSCIQIDGPNYLFIEDNFKTIEDQFWETNPLIASRASNLRKALFSNSERKKYLSKQVSTMEQHLSRLYRIRNEIVHDAVIDGNFMTLISSLRYYLVFILSSLIESLVQSTPEKGVHGIQEFLVRNKMRFDYLNGIDFDLKVIKESQSHSKSLNIFSKTYIRP